MVHSEIHTRTQKAYKNGEVPSKHAFANEILKSPECSFGPLHKTIRAIESLKAGHQWTVDNENYESVFLALADKQPREILLLARDDATDDIPEEAVAAIATIAKNCSIRVNFIDSFYGLHKTKGDLIRLQCIISNPSLSMTEFFGHLDAAGIALLPHTVATLGLAITNEAEAAAISGLQPWTLLKNLSVSVDPDVACQVLMPLPNVQYTRLQFPQLTSLGVEKVRASIEKLVPELRVTSLHFPKCKMTTEGMFRMVQRLDGVKVSNFVAIEAGTSWNPGDEEKENFEKLMCKAWGCNSVCW